jgi:hypothetical protein
VIDFADAVIQYFVDLRAKGLTVSGIDQQTLLDWERRDVSLHIVLEGIDAAFARKKDPPKSLRECQRWVNAAAKKAGEATDAKPADAPAWPDPSEATSEESASAPSPRDREAARTDAWLALLRGDDVAVFSAAGTALIAEVTRRRSAGADEIELGAVLDDAFAVYAMRELPPSQAAELRVAMAKAANEARERGVTDRAIEAQRRRALRDGIGAPAR